jgi:hypothetical protein
MLPLHQYTLMPSGGWYSRYSFRTGVLDASYVEENGYAVPPVVCVLVHTRPTGS